MINIKKEINEVSRVQPHFITTPVWKEMKVIIKTIASLCDGVNRKFENKANLDWANLVITNSLNYIGEIGCYDSDCYEAECYVNQMFEFYIDLALEEEEFEALVNLEKLREMLNIILV